MNKLMLSSLIMLLSAASFVSANTDNSTSSVDQGRKHHGKKHHGKDHDKDRKFNKHVAGAVGFDLSRCSCNIDTQNQERVCFACCNNIQVNPLSCRDCCFLTCPATLSVRPGPCCGFFVATLSFDVKFARPFCCEPVILLSGEVADRFENFCFDRVTRQPVCDLFSVIGVNRFVANVCADGFTAVVEYVLNTCDQHNKCDDALAFISEYVSSRRLNFDAVVSCKKRKTHPNGL